MIKSKVSKITYKADEEQTISNNIDTVLMLQEDLWNELSNAEKIDVLQTIADIERTYLGIPHELNVVVDYDLEKNISGFYRCKDHQIVLNSDSLKNDSAEELVDTICHEAFHAYQHCIVSVFENSEDTSKNLMLFRDAKKYGEEFRDYKSSEDGFDVYFYQCVEIDAREYAQSAVNDYYRRIGEYKFAK